MLKEYQKYPFHYILEWGELAVLSYNRRAWKDYVSLFTMIEKASMYEWEYAYILPNIRMAICVIEQNKQLFPKGSIFSSSRHTLTLSNGSIIYFQSEDSVNVNREYLWVVLSEYAFFKTNEIYDILKNIRSCPWMLISSTPNGKNHFYNLYYKEKENILSFTQHINNQYGNIPTS